MKHYKSLRFEPIEIIETHKLPFSVGNVIKYVSRYKQKGGAVDLRKALRYVDYIAEYNITISQYVEKHIIEYCRANHIVDTPKRVLVNLCKLHRGLSPTARKQQLAIIRNNLNDLIHAEEE